MFSILWPKCFLCLFSDILAIMSLSAGLLLLDINRLRPTGSHTISSLISQYTTHKIFYLIGSILHLSFNRQSANCRRHQEILLKKIIRQNKNTKCGQKFQIDGVKTVKDFRVKVRLTTYSDYREFANEILNVGSENVFFPGKTDYLAFTSGTTCGKSKVFPKNGRLMMKKMGLLMVLQQKCLLQVPRNNLLRKWLTVRVYPSFFYSKSGIKCGPVSGIAADRSLNFYVTPKKGRKASKEVDAIYINLVFGLLEEKICNLFFPTATLALTFFRTLEKSWRAICDDIENGTISNCIDISSDLRTSFQELLNGGNPERAAALRNEFQKGFEAIVPRIWVWCPALFCISSGTYQTQVYRVYP